MVIRSEKDLLKYLRQSNNIQLNKPYRKKYIENLREEIRISNQRNKVGIKGYTKRYISQLESQLKKLDKEFPYIEKITITMGR